MILTRPDSLPRGQPFPFLRVCTIFPLILGISHKIPCFAAYSSNGGRYLKLVDAYLESGSQIAALSNRTERRNGCRDGPNAAFV